MLRYLCKSLTSSLYYSDIYKRFFLSQMRIIIVLAHSFLFQTTLGMLDGIAETGYL